MIDVAILVAVGSVVGSFYPVVFGADAALYVWPSVALYFIAFEASPLRGTPGKRICGLQVLARNGDRAGIVRVFARTVAKVLSGMLLGIGFLLCIFTPRRQALHDLITRSVVVAGKVTPSGSEALSPGPAKRLGMVFGGFAGIVLAIVGVSSFFAIVMPDKGGDLVTYLQSGGKDDPKAVGRRVKLPKTGPGAATAGAQ
jgi:uncharacterized RDD family membrane protein YckC